LIIAVRFKARCLTGTVALTAGQTAQIAAAKQVIHDAFVAALEAGVPKEKAGILVNEEFGAAILRQCPCPRLQHIE
jgi:hypothetical protein